MALKKPENDQYVRRTDPLYSKIKRSDGFISSLMGEGDLVQTTGDVFDTALDGAAERALDRTRPLHERKQAQFDARRQKERERAEGRGEGTSPAANAAAASLAEEQVKKELTGFLDSLTPEGREFIHDQLVERASEDAKALTPDDWSLQELTDDEQAEADAVAALAAQAEQDGVAWEDTPYSFDDEGDE